MKLEELKSPKLKKKLIDVIPGWKMRNARVGIIKWCCFPTKKWKAENDNDKEWNFDAEPISDADKE